VTTNEAWELVKAGVIRGEWRRWQTADGREFHWTDLETRREALIEAAEHVAKK